MKKLAAMLATVLVSLGLASLLPAQPPPPHEDGHPKGKHEAKKKAEGGPRHDLTKAYDLLRRLRSNAVTAGRPDERIQEWTDRATQYYRDGLRAFEEGDDFHAHEYGAIAHDLARAADHARNAALFDRRDLDLEPPPSGPGSGDESTRTTHDLWRAYERITKIDDDEKNTAAGFYIKAARDLYSAARRDLDAGRDERGGELARSAEAMTHVIDHLGHAMNGPPDENRKNFSKGRPHPKPIDEAKEKAEGPQPKGKLDERRGRELPPELPPR